MDDETKDLVVLGSRVPALRDPDDAVEQIIRVLDVIASRMALETPHPSTARKVRGGRTVPREFVAGVVGMVEWMPELNAARTIDLDAAREVLDSSDAYRQVRQRVAELLASLNYTIEAKWARVASDAMVTFRIASVHAKDPKKAKLATRVAALSKLLGRKGRKKKRAE